MTRTTWLGPLLAVLLVPGFAAAQDGDIGRTTQNICCGGSCCLIGGVCLNNGDTNPMDMCEICDIGQSQTGYSVNPTCVDAGPADSDAGPGATDAGPGPVEVDAGPGGGTDAGPGGGTDAGPGAGPMDAGPGDGDDGGCSVGRGDSAAWPGLAVLALGLAAFVRRRR